MACLALGACSAVKVAPLKTTPSVAEGVAARIADPSPATLQTLRLFQLETSWRDNPAAVVANLDTLVRQLEDPRLLVAQAELALAAARWVEPQDAQRSEGWYFLAAVRAWDFVFGPQGMEGSALPTRAFDGRFHEALGIYNQALGAYVRLRQEHGWRPTRVQNALFENLVVRLDRSGPAVDPSRFDRLMPADELRVRGPRNHYRRDGLGAALVAVRENRGEESLDRFRPPEGIIRPLTAVLIPSPVDPRHRQAPRGATLAFYDPLTLELLPAGPYLVPLAGDFTTPYAYLTGTANLGRLAGSGLWRAEKTLWHQGIFMLEPYDPTKIPVLMVHGLRSSPLTWLELTNDLYGEADLRRRYQVWHYMYSTGFPFLYSAAELRRRLDELCHVLDPEDDDEVLDSMVVVGHSMGGLLSRTLVSDSEQRLWDLVVRVPPDELIGLPEGEGGLWHGLLFEADPRVDRVIFAAVPHRGSSLADSFFGRLGAQLVEIPEEAQRRVQALRELNPGSMTELGDELMAKGMPSSIEVLAEDNPVLLAVADLPFRNGVRVHTILGDRRRIDGAEGSDGLVSWASGHLDGVESELVVSSGHDVHTHPAAIGEIKRILRLHLRDLARDGDR